jgi:16S rRNA processing protein RimM
LYVGGAERCLVAIRDSGKTAVARFEGISDRSAAEALRGSLVEIDRSALPPLEKGEYYHADLIGLPAVDCASNAVGTVVAVENYGAGDLLEIELEGGKRSLIPFSKGIADLDDGRIVLDPEFLA